MDKELTLIKYKPAKTTDEMVDYLHNCKNVVYNTFDKETAKSILLKYNYINVITPFKHKFVKLGNYNKVIKVNNKHIYENEVEFSSYYKEYKNERIKYPNIYKNISKFETVFKSIVSYMIVNDSTKISNSYELYDYIEKAEARVYSLTKYSEKRKNRIIENLVDIKNSIEKYHDIYCLFDRLSLGHLLSLYLSLDNRLKTDIFLEMKEKEMTFGVVDSSQFEDRVFTLVAVRNCVYHNNSLEILVRFYDLKTKSERIPKDRYKFVTMIDYLSKEKQFAKQTV